MSSPASSIDSLRTATAVQAEHVKLLKKTPDTNKQLLEQEINKLKDLKIQLASAEAADPATQQALLAAKAKKEADKNFRAGLEDILTRRFFVIPAFEIYQGVAGLYDFGPTGCAVKQNLISAWRQHFVHTENMLEIDCTCLTPEVVLKTSGHVDKFTDFMVKDLKTGDCYRADKLLEEYVERRLDDVKAPPNEALKSELLAVGIQAGAMSAQELKNYFDKYEIKAPDTGNDLSEPFAFNLMFQSSIGPSGKMIGYLRPETAQGIFVNFRRLLEANAGKMPFAAAQIGLAFRNEISPRQGLLRVREFALAEIEHFVNPNDKSHAKFGEVQDIVLNLLPRTLQVTGEESAIQITVREAVEQKMINNQTLAYYMARTQLFLVYCGVKIEKLRFRQHKATEMAHYASDCWDAEIQSSYGWVECVGHADRAAYDLQVHTKASKVELIAQESFDQPKMVEVANINTNNALLGKTFGKKSKEVMEYLRSLSNEENKTVAFQIEAALASSGNYTVKLCTGDEFAITREMVKITPETKKVSTIKYIPSVIEPSFGLGRILYSILEHAYYVRNPEQKEEKDKRAVLSLPAHMAPTKLIILPLSDKEAFVPFSSALSKQCITASISSRVDSSGSSIGRRYARADEIGVPYGITIDFQTIQDRTVTIRERDSMQQVRIDADRAIGVISQLCTSLLTWDQVKKEYPIFVSGEKDE